MDAEGDAGAVVVGKFLEELPEPTELQDGDGKWDEGRYIQMLQLLKGLPLVQAAFDRLLTSVERERRALQQDVKDAQAHRRVDQARALWEAWEAAAFDYREGASEDGVREDFETWLRGKWKPEVPADPVRLLCPGCRGGLQVAMLVDEPDVIADRELRVYCPAPLCDREWIEPGDLVVAR